MVLIGIEYCLDMSMEHRSSLSKIVLFLSIIICVTLIVCIALVFTTDGPTTSCNNGYENNMNKFVTPEPCRCGCSMMRDESSIPDSWPWQMLLIYYNDENSPLPLCSGSLITANDVLTTAECVATYSAAHIGVIPVVRYINDSSYS